MNSVDTPQHPPAAEDVAAPFTIAVDHQVDGNRLTLTGALDMASAPQLDNALAHLHPNSHFTTLDCSGLTFCDSTGLSVLIRAHQNHQANGNHLALTASPHVLQRLLALTGLDHFLDTAARPPTGPDVA